MVCGGSYSYTMHSSYVVYSGCFVTLCFAMAVASAPADGGVDTLDSIIPLRRICSCTEGMEISMPCTSMTDVVCSPPRDIDAVPTPMNEMVLRFGIPVSAGVPDAYTYRAAIARITNSDFRDVSVSSVETAMASDQAYPNASDTPPLKPPSDKASPLKPPTAPGISSDKVPPLKPPSGKAQPQKPPTVADPALDPSGKAQPQKPPTAPDPVLPVALPSLKPVPEGPGGERRAFEAPDARAGVDARPGGRTRRMAKPHL
jgi:hypothetical protein